MRASRDGRLPRYGHISRHFTFRFHGIGCAFQRGKLIVDVDFPSDGEWDAFDAWRLSLFAGALNKDPLQVAPIQEALEALLTRGLIVPTGTNRLLRLKKATGEP